MNPPRGLVVLTDRWQARRPLPEVVAAAVAGGARCVVLREKDLPRAERVGAGDDQLPADLRQDRPQLAGEPLGGDAVHLPAAGAYPPPP
ncbi:thiamine phosphate synthase, partial [Micromonospora globispora]